MKPILLRGYGFYSFTAFVEYFIRETLLSVTRVTKIPIRENSTSYLLDAKVLEEVNELVVSLFSLFFS